MKPKILVVLGPTATGKSSLAVEIAKKFSAEGGPTSGWNGAEIISADSRQVYKGLDIGTGKITEEEMDGVPHYLLDVVEPNEDFNVVDFKKLAEEKIEEILNKGKLPIVVGGTGFYIQAIVDGLILPEVPPNKELREKLENESPEELFEKLEKLSSGSAAMIYHSGGSENKRRLIRAIEIVEALEKIPKLEKNPKYEALQIGLDLDDQSVRSRISHRLEERIENGMIDEGKRVMKEIGPERMLELGLEYKYLALHLKGDKGKEGMIAELNTAIWQFAKRQRTWFRRDERIKWFKPDQKEEIFKEVEKFL